MGGFQPSDYLMTALVAPIYFFLAQIILIFNDLIFLRQRVKRAWANIEVSLKKRADLVPNLERIVKHYFKHEKETMEALAGFRREAAQPNSGESLLAAEHQINERLTALVEAYPDLKANEQINGLHQSLVRLENEIALMREGYNDSVERLNTAISHFPDLFIARLAGIKEAQHYSVASTLRQAPRIDL